MKMAPSAAEMAGNKPAGAKQQAKQGITMAIAPPSKEELAKALDEARKANQGAVEVAAQPSAARTATAGGGKGALIAAVAAVILVLLAAGFMISGMGKTGRLRSNVSLLMGQAKASGLDGTPAYKKADQALKNADTFMGSITGASALEEAEKDLQKLLAQKTGGSSSNSNATVDDANNARKAMLARKQTASDVDAANLAQVEWSKAESYNDSGEKALDAKSYGEAQGAFMSADDSYRRATVKSREGKARAEIESRKAKLATALQSAEAAKAREHIPELVEGASAAKAEAERLQQSDVVHALHQMQYADLLMQSAVRLAPEIEKKN